MTYRISALLYCFLLLAYRGLAQTNIFPATGNAGIGTVSPSFALGGSSTGIHITGSGGAYATLNLQRLNNGQGSIIDFSNASNVLQYRIGTNFSSGGDLFHIAYGSSPTIGMTMDNAGKVGINTSNPTVKFSVNSGINTSSANVITMQQSTDGANKDAASFGLAIQNGGETTNAADMIIGTASGGSLRERMRITSSGNVGIGTDAPNAKLEVSGNIFTSSQTNYIQFGTDAATAPYVQGSTNGDLAIGTQNTGKLFIKASGMIGIGTLSPSEKLSVNGNIAAKKVIVTQTGWSDYVFHSSFKLRPLSQVASYIKAFQHLPEMPSAKEVLEHGVSLGDTQALLLKKIEELTLYILQQEENSKHQEMRIRQLERRLDRLINK